MAGSTSLARVGKRLPRMVDDGDGPVNTGQGTVDKRSRPLQRLGRDKLLVTLGLPGAIVLILFQYVPLLGNVIAFQDYQPYLEITEAPFVGPAELLLPLGRRPRVPQRAGQHADPHGDPDRAGVPGAAGAGPAAEQPGREKLKRLLQSVLYLPHFLSWVIVVALFQQMLGNAGMLNTFLVQNDLPIGRRSSACRSCSRRCSPPRRSGRTRAGARSSSWPRSPGSTRSSTRPPRWTAPTAGSGWCNITLPALKGLFILLLILRLGQQPVGRLRADHPAAGAGRARGERGARHLGLQQRHHRRQLGRCPPRPGWSRASSASVLVIGANKLAHMFGERGVYQR